MPNSQTKIYCFDGEGKEQGSVLCGLGYQVYVHDSINELLSDLNSEYACLLLSFCSEGQQLFRKIIDLKVSGIYPIIFFYDSLDIASFVNYVKQGASSFCCRSILNQKISCLVEQACAEHSKEAFYFRRRLHQKFTLLTGREKEVCLQLMLGNSTKELARMLALSPHTIDVHRTHIMRKMGVTSIDRLVYLMSHYIGNK